MNPLHTARAVLRWLFRRKRVEQELQNELQEFIRMSAEDKMRDGIPPQQARRLAALELGGIEQAKEQVRTKRHGAWMDEIGQDLRYALRTFAKTPGFTAVVLTTLALGIGANTAIFSLMDALMLRWLPVRNPQELIQLKYQLPDGRAAQEALGATFSYAIVRALAEEKEIFSGVAGFSSVSPLNVGPLGNIQKVPATMATGGYFETLGVQAAAGRLLSPADDLPDAPLAAVITDGFWERQFARSPEAVGQVLPINGIPFIIVGVSAFGFIGANVGAVSDITIPVAALPRVYPTRTPLLGPGTFWLRIIARPKPGMSITAAKDRLMAAWPPISERVISPNWPPDRRKAMSAAAFTFDVGGKGWTSLRNAYLKPLRVLMALVGSVLMIACANVASLLLARVSARRRETAVRLAIGASRGRIIRQHLVESLLLSLIGAGFGIGVAWLSSSFLVQTISSGGSPVFLDLTPNLHVLGFTIAIALATGILFGLAPAVQISRSRPSSMLKEQAQTFSQSRLLPSLVVVQVTVSLILLIGASLFIRTLQNLQNLDTGFNREGVLLASFEDGAKFRADLLEQIRHAPGVVHASISTDTPLSGGLWTEPAVPKGEPIPERDNAIIQGVGPGYFETMQTPLLRGRGVSDSDSYTSRSVAVINEEFARQFFPNTNPVGRLLSTKARVGPGKPGDLRELEIVGVAKNTHGAGLRRDPYPTVYVSYAQLNGVFPLTVEIRVSGSFAAAASAIRSILQPNFPSAPVELRPLSAQVEAQMVQERMMATLAGGFAGLALLLASVGLYGLLAYGVARRTKEIGIRISLGAHPKRLVRMVLRSALRLVLLGLAFGLPAAWAASHWTRSMLFGLEATDPEAIGAAVLLLIGSALVAAWLPARRASRVDPMTALRHE